MSGINKLPNFDLFDIFIIVVTRVTDSKAGNKKLKDNKGLKYLNLMINFIFYFHVSALHYKNG